MDGVKLTPDDDNTCRESLGTKQAFFFQYATMTRLKTTRTPMLAKVEPKITPSCPEIKKMTLRRRGGFKSSLSFLWITKNF